MKQYMILANGIGIHVNELGEGPAVLFCHGFPLLGVSWRSQMAAVAAAGYRAIAPDLRGMGKSDAPDDPLAYSPLHTVGDMIGVLDALEIDKAAVVGQDAGGEIAWSAALFRPDRFVAVYGIYPALDGLSACFLKPQEPSLFKKLRSAGYDDFYMFRQMKPEADKIWACASDPIASALYWTSGQAPDDLRWDPFNPSTDMLRPVPEALSWIDDDLLHEISRSYKISGFRGGLNYYRSWEPYFEDIIPCFAGARVFQPAFLVVGLKDGLSQGVAPTVDQAKMFLPNLRGVQVLDDVGHWPQLEAPEVVNQSLLKFLEEISF